MFIPMPKTADKETLQVKKLCERLVPNEQALYLNVELREGALENECYGNVERVIALKGGSVQYGWQLWETLPGVLLEAEFHAVWIDVQGIPHDVTPKSSICQIDQILFLPDPNRTYEGRQIDNVRVALQDDPLIQEFIECNEEYFRLTNQGDLADYHGMIMHTPEMRASINKRYELIVALCQKYPQK
jgi:hypothetical protein